LLNSSAGWALEANPKPVLLRRLAPADIPARAREPLAFLAFGVTPLGSRFPGEER